jgi:membrane protease YdiL (CAAX protease family)
LPLALHFRLPTLWLLVPVAIITLTRRPSEEYGLTWKNPGGARLHLSVCAAVFVPYLVGHYLFATLWLGQTFTPRLPAQIGRLILDHTLAIGLPEEVFFRGYLQTHGDRVWGTRWQFAGAHFGWGLLVAAALFAVCHIGNGGPARLIVFFPGLLYGWLRARTGTIAVPAAYHAASNVLMAVMLASLQTNEP